MLHCAVLNCIPANNRDNVDAGTNGNTTNQPPASSRDPMVQTTMDTFMAAGRDDVGFSSFFVVFRSFW